MSALKPNVIVTWFQKSRTLNCLKTPNQLAAQIIPKGIDLDAMGSPKQIQNKMNETKSGSFYTFLYKVMRLASSKGK
jgi:hypothetical protein